MANRLITTNPSQDQIVKERKLVQPTQKKVGSIGGTLLTAGLSLGTNIIGSLINDRLNAKRQQEQNEYQKQLWEENNAYNSPSAQMSRLVSMGMSPAAAMSSVAGNAPVASTASTAADYSDSSMSSGFTAGASQSADNILTQRMQDIQDENYLRQNRLGRDQLDLDLRAFAQKVKMDNQQYDFNEQMNDLKLTEQRLINKRGQTENTYALAGLNVFLHSHGLNEDGSMSADNAKIMADEWKSRALASIAASNYDEQYKKKMTDEIDKWYKVAINTAYANLRLALANASESEYDAALKKLTKEQIDALPDNLKTYATCGEMVGVLLDYEEGNDKAIRQYKDFKAAQSNQGYTFKLAGGLSVEATRKLGVSADAEVELRGEPARLANEMFQNGRLYTWQQNKIANRSHHAARGRW